VWTKEKNVITEAIHPVSVINLLTRQYILIDINITLSILFMESTYSIPSLDASINKIELSIPFGLHDEYLAKAVLMTCFYFFFLLVSYPPKIIVHPLEKSGLRWGLSTTCHSIAVVMFMSLSIIIVYVFRFSSNLTITLVLLVEFKFVMPVLYLSFHPMYFDFFMRCVNKSFDQLVFILF